MCVDHDDNLVAENHDFGGSWSGDYPDAIKDIAYDQVEGSQPRFEKIPYYDALCTQNVCGQ